MSTLSAWLSTQNKPIAGMIKPTGLPGGMVNPYGGYTAPGAGTTGSGLRKNITPPPPPGGNNNQPPQGFSGGGGGGYEMGGYQPGWQPQMPGLPQEPQVTQDLIRQWQERAKQEAGMIYDPQVMAIQQELDKAILAASQSAGNIPGYYEDILSQIKEWQKQETGAMQQRYFARGLGRGGGLIQEEGKIAETALKSTTQAETEKARKLTDIEAQKQQLTEQAGAKTTGAKTAEGQYIASRAADLQDSYVSQKQQLEQQKFQNQMAIQQFGLTAETQNFQNWLSSMELSADIWYKNSQMALAQESQRLSSMAKSGSGKSGLGKPTTLVGAGKTTDSSSISNTKGFQYPIYYAKDKASTMGGYDLEAWLNNIYNSPGRNQIPYSAY